jgi:hypothetical protein
MGDLGKAASDRTNTGIVGLFSPLSILLFFPLCFLPWLFTMVAVAHGSMDWMRLEVGRAHAVSRTHWRGHAPLPPSNGRDP